MGRFLGNYQPQPNKAEVWELDADKLYDLGRNGETNIDLNERFDLCLTVCKIAYILVNLPCVSVISFCVCSLWINDCGPVNEMINLHDD